MSNREQDKRVAEILGFRVRQALPDYFVMIIPAGHETLGYETDVPRFTTDPAADYKVLEWVRSTFQLGAARNIHVLDAFTKHFTQARYAAADALGEVHKYEYSLMYQPGDYSRALLALDEQGLLK